MAVLADGGDPLITSAPYIFVPENTDAAFYATTAITLAGGPAPLDDAVEAFDPDGLFQFDNNTAGRLPALLVNGPAAGDVLALRTNGTPCNLPFPQSPDLFGWEPRMAWSPTCARTNPTALRWTRRARTSDGTSWRR